MTPLRYHETDRGFRVGPSRGHAAAARLAPPSPFPDDEHGTNGPGSLYPHRELPGGIFPQARVVTFSQVLVGANG